MGTYFSETGGVYEVNTKQLPMSKTSTTEKLVLYLFNETGMTDSVLIQRDIDNDEEVEMEFTNIKRAFRFVDKALIDPSPKSVINILRYAARTAVKSN